jgi:hypothetical protein
MTVSIVVTVSMVETEIINVIENIVIIDVGENLKGTAGLRTKDIRALAHLLDSLLVDPQTHPLERIP